MTNINRKERNTGSIVVNFAIIFAISSLCFWIADREMFLMRAIVTTAGETIGMLWGHSMPKKSWDQLIEKSFLVIIGIVLIGNVCELTSVVVIDLCSSIIASLILFNRFFRVEEREE